MASFAYHDPNVAEAYGNPTRPMGAREPTLASQGDAMAISQGQDQGSQEMVDEALDRAMKRAQ